MRYLIHSLCVVFFAWLTTSCDIAKSDLGIFFEQVDKTLSAEEMVQIRSCHETSCLMEFVESSSNAEFERMFYDMPSNVTSILDSVGIKEYPMLVMFVAYNKKMNNEEFSYGEIEKDLIQYFIEKEENSRARSIEDVIVRSEVAESRYTNCILGDTLCLEFPMDYRDERAEAFIPAPSFRELYTDTLRVKCVLLSKEKEPRSKQFELSHDFFILKLSIIHLSVKPCQLFGSVVNLGDEIDLDIFDYGKPLPSCAATTSVTQ